jgi:hypothetical protein
VRFGPRGRSAISHRGNCASDTVAVGFGKAQGRRRPYLPSKPGRNESIWLNRSNGFVSDGVPVQRTARLVVFMSFTTAAVCFVPQSASFPNPPVVVPTKSG